MKHLFFIIVLAFYAIFAGCNKSNKQTVNSPAFNAMQGKWFIKSIRCYQDQPNAISIHPEPDSYYRFNWDKTGEYYSGSITNSHEYFTYWLLANDSTLIKMHSTITWTPQPDTFIIMKLNANEFYFHSARTYPSLPSLSFCYNIIDSLYK